MRDESTTLSLDPRAIIDKGKMSTLQVIAVTLCILLNALDGFDVLAISFAAPGISAEWGITRAALGVVLSMELIGMAIGSVVIGSIADTIGRRPSILGCLVIMGSGMFLTSTASDVYMLSGCRFFTGIGIGGMLAAINAMAAEYSNENKRDLVITILGAGYPIGAVIGGSFASYLLTVSTWQSIFVFGGIVTSCFIPLVWLFVPESISYLSTKQPPNALEKINKTLNKFGHPTIDELPPKPEAVAKISIAQLFAPKYIRTTVLLTITYFALILTFYFILKWIPKIVVDMGHAPSAAGGVLVWANVGGAAGSLLLGFLSQKLPLEKLLLGSLVAAFASVVYFGQAAVGLSELTIAAIMAGFFTTASVVGVFALFVRYFDTEVRASGTGFAIGIGRGGSALGPILAGVLFTAGMSLGSVAIMMGSGALIAAIAVFFLTKKS